MRFGLGLICLAMLAMTAARAQPAPPEAAVAAGSLPTVGITEIEGSINGSDFATMIETAITRSGRFRVIERSQLKTLLQEQARCGRGGPVAASPGCHVGGISPVQYAIYGKFSVDRKDGGGFLVTDIIGCILFSCPKHTDTITVDIKITDLQSGLLKGAFTVTHVQKSGSSGYDDSLFRQAAEKISTSLIQNIFPIAIASVRPDGSLLLNYGSDLLSSGQYLKAYQLGAPVVDPSGGRIIVDRQDVGIVRVTTVRSDTANAIYVGGGPGPIKAGQLLEPIDPQDAQAALRGYRGPKWRPG